MSDLLDRKVAPTRNWLHNQGLRKSTRVEANHPPDHRDPQDFGGVDGPDDSVYKISSMLRAPDRVQPPSSPKGSVLEPDKIDHSQHSACFQVQHTNNTSDSVPLSEQLPSSWGRKRDEDGLPSATITTLQQSPRTSRFGLISRLSGQRGKAESKETLGVHIRGELVPGKG